LDLYCGTGTIGIAFTKAYGDAMLVGIEEIESAVADAYKNAQTNALQSDYHFFAGKVEKLLSMQSGKLTIKNTTGELIIDNQNLGLVIVDPPRSGLHEGAIQTLLELKQQTPGLRVCYISCNPVTLARDLKLLSESYTFDTVQPVDMFPHTYHIENIVILN
ncbi:MAG: methyltransferase domain-containing protein, partial [Candidatus Absconditabacterales bacterium]